MRKKVLISAYAISPTKGSEFASAWNTVTQLAQNNELWVLFGISDDHMGDTHSLLNYIKINPVPSVTFIRVEAGLMARVINLLNKAGAGWFFYLAYYLWQKNALKAAKRLMNEVEIDLVHQLGPIGYREPGFLWQLNKPMVWGPIGGMMQIDKRLIRDKPFFSRLKFITKNLINYLQLNYSPRIKKAFNSADVLIAATLTGQKAISEQFGRSSYYLPETWLIARDILNESKFRHINEQVQLIWCGTHNERKNLQLCLRALAKVKQRNWVLNVLGSGPLTPVLKELAQNLNLTDHIVWHGQLERDNAIGLMATSHLHIITSIAEDNPNVVFEALSCGVPSLTINHFGMGDTICSKCGFKVEVGENQIIEDEISRIVDQLLNDPQVLVKMAQTTLSCASEHNASNRLSKFNNIYDEAIAIHQTKYRQVLIPQYI